jgi:hypothetical protein
MGTVVKLVMGFIYGWSHYKSSCLGWLASESSMAWLDQRDQKGQRGQKYQKQEKEKAGIRS